MVITNQLFLAKATWEYCNSRNRQLKLENHRNNRNNSWGEVMYSHRGSIMPVEGLAYFQVTPIVLVSCDFCILLVVRTWLRQAAIRASGYADSGSMDDHHQEPSLTYAELPETCPQQMCSIRSNLIWHGLNPRRTPIVALLARPGQISQKWRLPSLV